MNAARAWRRFARTFSTAYPHPRLLVLVLVVVAPLGAVAWFRGFPSFSPIEYDALYALLTGMPATLGTLFVLAFTFTLVSAQIASNYSHIFFRRVLGPWVLWYAVPFGIGILLPLYLLNGHFYLWTVQVSLVIVAFCVVSLLPFGVAVRALVSVEGALVDHAEQIETAETADEAQGFCRDLGDISVGALTLRDFATFESGVDLLVGCSGQTTATDLRLPVVQEIRRMILRNPSDQFAAEILTDAIVRAGLGEDGEDDIHGDSEILEEILRAYRSVHLSVFGDQDKAVGRITELARQEPLAASRCLAVLHVIGERSISEIPVESGSASTVIRALGLVLHQQVRSYGRPTGDEVVLLSALRRIEFLGERAQLHDKKDLASLAVQQVRAAIGMCPPGQASLKEQLNAVLAVIENP